MKPKYVYYSVTYGEMVEMTACPLCKMEETEETEIKYVFDDEPEDVLIVKAQFPCGSLYKGCDEEITRSDLCMQYVVPGTKHCGECVNYDPVNEFKGFCKRSTPWMGKDSTYPVNYDASRCPKYERML